MISVSSILNKENRRSYTHEQKLFKKLNYEYLVFNMAKYLLRNTLVALMCSHARHAYRARQITKKWPGKCLESLISQEKKENVQKNARIMYFQCLSFHLVYISSVKFKKNLRHFEVINGLFRVLLYSKHITHALIGQFAGRTPIRTEKLKDENFYTSSVIFACFDSAVYEVKNIIHQH